jgi:hypothetical protein
MGTPPAAATNVTLPPADGGAQPPLLLAAAAALGACVGAHAREYERRGLVFRSLTRVERRSDNADSAWRNEGTPSVAYLNAAFTSLLAAANVTTVDTAALITAVDERPAGSPLAGLGTVLTMEGYHPIPLVQRQMWRQVFTALWLREAGAAVEGGGPEARLAACLSEVGAALGVAGQPVAAPTPAVQPTLAPHHTGGSASTLHPLRSALANADAVTVVAASALPLSLLVMLLRRRGQAAGAVV